MKWKDNKGFSLVELIISMSVLLIVSLAIMVLIQYGTRSYSFAKSELNLQMEAQTLLAQMNTMIQESNYAEYDAANHVLTLYQVDEKSIENVPTATPGIPAATSTPTGYSKKSFTVTKTVTDQKFIYYNSADHTLNLYEHNHEQTTPASSGAVSSMWGCGGSYNGVACECSAQNDGLFSEYLDEITTDGAGNTLQPFEAKINGNEITITLRMKSGKRTYTTEATSKMRNRVVSLK